jgi:hypothetical protein
MTGASRDRRAGAALIESSLAMMMLCLILFGLLQVSYLVAAKDVVSFSAFAASRSATVGMKDEFVERVVRTTSIPIAGPMVGEPYSEASLGTGGSMGQTWDRSMQASPSSQQYWAEKHIIPYYLGAVDETVLGGLLNYYNWVSTDTRISSSPRHTSDSVEVYVQQYVPLAFPFSRAFYRGNMGTMVREDGTHSVPRSPIDAGLEVENHSKLYLTSE